MIIGSIFISVKHGKQLFQLSILIVTSRGTVDDIPVEVHIAAAVIRFKVRHKGIILRTVPYDIIGAPFLEIRNRLIHHLSRTVLPVRRFPEKKYLLS